MPSRYTHTLFRRRDMRAPGLLQEAHVAIEGDIVYQAFHIPEDGPPPPMSGVHVPGIPVLRRPLHPTTRCLRFRDFEGSADVIGTMTMEAERIPFHVMNGVQLDAALVGLLLVAGEVHEVAVRDPAEIALHWDVPLQVRVGDAPQVVLAAGKTLAGLSDVLFPSIRASGRNWPKFLAHPLIPEDVILSVADPERLGLIMDGGRVPTTVDFHREVAELLSPAARDEFHNVAEYRQYALVVYPDAVNMVRVLQPPPLPLWDRLDDRSMFRDSVARVRDTGQGTTLWEHLLTGS
jgi:hypothetical protein